MADRSEREASGGRLGALLLGLTVLFVLYPVMVHLGRVRSFRLVFGAALIVAVYAIGRSRRHLLAALLLGVPALVGQFVIYVVPTPAALMVGTLLSALFLVYTTAVVLRSVVATGPVSGDRIAGAISAYLLIGLVWALLYVLVETMLPGAFLLPEGLTTGVEAGGEYAFIYYSFVTLTTLGYGEISPAVPLSQSLAWMEAVTGQLFLAILVARLVALHLTATRDARR